MKTIAAGAAVAVTLLTVVGVNWYRSRKKIQEYSSTTEVSLLRLNLLVEAYCINSLPNNIEGDQGVAIASLKRDVREIREYLEGEVTLGKLVYYTKYIQVQKAAYNNAWESSHTAI